MDRSFYPFFEFIINHIILPQWHCCVNITSHIQSHKSQVNIFGKLSSLSGFLSITVQQLSELKNPKPYCQQQTFNANPPKEKKKHHLTSKSFFCCFLLSFPPFTSHFGQKVWQNQRQRAPLLLCLHLLTTIWTMVFDDFLEVSVLAAAGPAEAAADCAKEDAVAAEGEESVVVVAHDERMNVCGCVQMCGVCGV